MKSIYRILFALIVGVVFGAAGVALLPELIREEGAEHERVQEPLYWVAPMDPNFRRDEPGKSPMGMDLIPVYEDLGGEAPAGSVMIAPHVVNNLGVRTASVEYGRLQPTVDTVGYVQYDEDRLVHVHPRVAGWIEVLHVKASGDPVKKGEPLYTLYSPTLVNAQEEFLLALKRGSDVLIGAAAERLAALQVPAVAIDMLRETGQVTRSITLYAPQDGVVDNLQAREGMYVEPGMKIMSIGSLEHVWVIAEVFERQAALVELGDPVEMRLDYLPGRTWRGRIDYIYPSLNVKTRTAQVRVRFENPDNYLRPGMFAQMKIATRPRDKTLLVPREALIRTGTQSRVVLALDEGHFKSVAVAVGRIAGEQAEIVSGLVAGDRIVISAQFLIDSESSTTSDLMRMESEAVPAAHVGHPAMGNGQQAAPRARVNINRGSGP